MPFYQFGLNPNQKDGLTEYVLDHMESVADSVNVGGDLVIKGNIEVDGSVTMPNLQLDLTTDEVEETTTKQYLTNSAQTITGEKTFQSVRVESGGLPTLELHRADGSIISGETLAELRITAEDNNPKGRTCALMQAKCVNTFPSGLDENGDPNSENATTASTQLDFFCQDSTAVDQIAGNPLLSLVGPGRIVSVNGTFQPSVISASGEITSQGPISGTALSGTTLNTTGGITSASINITGSNGLSGMVTMVLGERNNTFTNGTHLAYGNGSSNSCFVAPVSGKIIAASSTFFRGITDSNVTSITLGIEIGSTLYKPLPASQSSTSIEPHQYQSNADGLVDNSTTLTFQAGDTLKMTIEDITGPTTFVGAFVGAIWIRYD